jgi:protein-tyrosine kinase
VASRCGSALVIARQDANRVKPLQDLVDTLQAAHVRLAGVVMNEF